MELCLLTPDTDFNINVIGRAFRAGQAPMSNIAIFSAISAGKGPLRAIPIKKSIKAENHVASYAELETYLNQSDIYSVADCACKKCAVLVGDPSEHDYHEICLQIGPEAEYYVRTGRARQINREEAEQIIQKAERRGLVRQIFNNEGANQSTFICACDGYSRGVLSCLRHDKATDPSKSNFVAKADPEKCVACGECAQVCPMNAIRLGNTFCDTETQIPQMTRTPENGVWTNELRKQGYKTFYLAIGAQASRKLNVEGEGFIGVEGGIDFLRRVNEGRVLLN